MELKVQHNFVLYNTLDKKKKKNMFILMELKVYSLSLSITFRGENLLMPKLAYYPFSWK